MTSIRIRPCCVTSLFLPAGLLSIFLLPFPEEILPAFPSSPPRATSFPELLSLEQDLNHTTHLFSPSPLIDLLSGPSLFELARSSPVWASVCSSSSPPTNSSLDAINSLRNPSSIGSEARGPGAGVSANGSTSSSTAFHRILRVFLDRVASLGLDLDGLRRPKDVPGEAPAAIDPSRVFASFLNVDTKNSAPLFGLVALLASYRATNRIPVRPGYTTHPYVVLSTKPFPQKVQEAFRRAFDVAFVTTGSTGFDHGNSKLAEWNAAFNKLIAFNLTQYKSLVLLDTDTLIYQDVRDMTAFPHLSVVRDYPTGCYERDTLNSGVVVIHPNTDDFVKLVKYRHTQKSCKDWQDFVLGDQELLMCITLRKKVPHRAPRHLRLRKVIHISFVYNAPVCQCQCRAGRDPTESVRWNQAEIRIGHFYLAKPWLVLPRWLEGEEIKRCMMDNVFIWWHYAALGFQLLDTTPAELLSWFM